MQGIPPPRHRVAPFRAPVPPAARSGLPPRNALTNDRTASPEAAVLPAARPDGPRRPALGTIAQRYARGLPSRRTRNRVTPEQREAESSDSESDATDDGVVIASGSDSDEEMLDPSPHFLRSGAPPPRPTTPAQGASSTTRLQRGTRPRRSPEVGPSARAAPTPPNNLLAAVPRRNISQSPPARAQAQRRFARAMLGHIDGESSDEEIAPPSNTIPPTSRTDILLALTPRLEAPPERGSRIIRSPSPSSSENELTPASSFFSNQRPIRGPIRQPFRRQHNRPVIHRQATQLTTGLQGAATVTDGPPQAPDDTTFAPTARASTPCATAGTERRNGDYLLDDSDMSSDEEEGLLFGATIGAASPPRSFAPPHDRPQQTHNVVERQAPQHSGTGASATPHRRGISNFWRTHPRSGTNHNILQYTGGTDQNEDEAPTSELSHSGPLQTPSAPRTSRHLVEGIADDEEVHSLYD